MGLTTFGAVMGFAAAMVKRSVEVYTSCIDRVNDPVLRESLQGLLEEEKKNVALMEQTRRENVTEMILEPITGLDEQHYGMDMEVPAPVRDVDLLEIALSFVENEYHFFSDAAGRVPLPEVARTFRKAAQKKERTLERLRSLRVG